MSKLTLEQEGPPPSKSKIAAEAARRRTFAIIAHPDAGKTTLTQHILLAGGATRAARGQLNALTADRAVWMRMAA